MSPSWSSKGGVFLALGGGLSRPKRQVVMLCVHMYSYTQPGIDKTNIICMCRLARAETRTHRETHTLPKRRAQNEGSVNGSAFASGHFKATPHGQRRRWCDYTPTEVPWRQAGYSMGLRMGPIGLHAVLRQQPASLMGLGPSYCCVAPYVSPVGPMSAIFRLCLSTSFVQPLYRTVVS